MKRLRLVLWIGVVFVMTMFALFLSAAVLDPQKFNTSYLYCCGAVELGLVTCLILHKTALGRRYPGLLFLGFCWSLTVVVQSWVAFGGINKLLIPLWTLVFLTQATLMPVRWRLHVLSQLSAFAWYLGLNAALGLAARSPFADAAQYLFLFWVCFICDLSAYLYERLQRSEFYARCELKTAYRKLETAEAKYRSIFENADEGIFQSTPDGCYITANPALARILGYNSPEELTANLTDIEHQFYVDPNRRAEFVRFIEQQGNLSNFESQVYRKDGSVVWVAEKARAVVELSGKLLYYEGLIEDITERKQAEEALRVFFHAVSHDLRNPVLGSLMVLKNLLKGSEEKVLIERSILERMIQSGERQLNLINSLLEAHASEVRGISCKCSPVPLSQLVEAAIADLEPMLAQNQATLTNLIPHTLPLVNADATQLWRVFSNLIVNALKHNSPGLNIIVDAKIDKQMIRCCVQDDGVGMSQDTCANLFELYVRGTNARNSLSLGLGLYLCRQIVTAHGGEIGVTSSPKAGATFWFTLPTAKA